MVTGFSSVSDEEEAKALRSYWAKEYAVVFPKAPSLDAASLVKGQEVHLNNCASCHSRPTAAFVSYGLAKAITPSALILESKKHSGRSFIFSFPGLFSGPGFVALHQIFSYPDQPPVASDQWGDGSDEGLSRQYGHGSGH